MNNVATLSFLYEQGNGDNEGKKFHAAMSSRLVTRDREDEALCA